MRPARPVLALILAIAASACGAAAGPTVRAPAPVVEPAPPAGYDVLRTTMFVSMLEADATHVYWVAEDGLWRRPHGPDQRAQRLLDADDIGALVVGRDDVFVLRQDTLYAIPRAGGPAAELATFDDAWPNLLAAERDGPGIVVELGDELVRHARGEAPQRRPVGPLLALAAAGGAAYAVNDASALIRIDLKTGETTQLAKLDVLAGAFGLAISGDTVLVNVGGMILAVPTRGGTAQVALQSGAGMYDAGFAALDADGDGYAAVSGSAVVTQRIGERPRVAARAEGYGYFRADGLVAIGGPYVYHVLDDGMTGEGVLRAAPRRSPVELWRISGATDVVALTAWDDVVYLASAGEEGYEIREVGPRGTKVIGKTDRWVAHLATNGTHLVAQLDGEIHLLDRKRGAFRSVSDEIWAERVVVHKAHLFWTTGTEIHAMKLPRGRPFRVADLGPLGADEYGLYTLEVTFAHGFMYLPLQTYGRLVIARVDERGRASALWQQRAESDEEPLQPTIARIGDGLFVTNGRRVWRVPVEGGDATLIAGTARPLPSPSGHGDLTFYSNLLAVGDRLVAMAYDDADGGQRLVELPIDGSPPRPIASLGYDYGPLAVVGDTIVMWSNELAGLLRVPVR